MKNKIILTIDGIRKDRLATYNNKAINISNNLYEISKRSVVFHDMMACGTSTAMCFASLFTGQYQKHFDRKKFGDNNDPFKDNVFTDHEKKGYFTAVSLNKRFKACSDLINTYGNAEFWWTGKETTSNNKNIGSIRPLEQAKFIEKKINQLDKNKPYLLWCHLWGFSKPEDRFLEKNPFDYDARVAELDEAVGYVFDKFSNESEFYIFADHGYAFFERDKWAYGKDGSNLTESVCAIPAMVFNGKDVGNNNNLVSQIEFRNIINNSNIALNLKSKKAYCETRYLNEFDKSIAIRDKNFKAVYDFKNKNFSLFDIKSDMNETIDLNGNYYHKVTRDKEGNHPPVKPFIIRADWKYVNRKIKELKDEAENFYDKTEISNLSLIKHNLKKNKMFYFFYKLFFLKIKNLLSK